MAIRAVRSSQRQWRSGCGNAEIGGKSASLPAPRVCGTDEVWQLFLASEGSVRAHGVKHEITMQLHLLTPTKIGDPTIQRTVHLEAWAFEVA